MRPATLILASFLVLFSAILNLAQSGQPCSVIDGARDTLFIEFEKTVENLPKGERSKEQHVILRLKNNSTCPILLTSADVPSFYESLPPKPTSAQLIEHWKNPKTREIADGEFISEFQYYTDIVFGSEVTVFTGSAAGDYFFAFQLKGGNSILFGVPFENFKQGKLILVPFKFAWEDEGRAKFRTVGDTDHFINFSRRSLPDEVLRRIKK